MNRLTVEYQSERCLSDRTKRMIRDIIESNCSAKVTFISDNVVDDGGYKKPEVDTSGIMA